MSSDVGWQIKDKLGPVPKHGSVLVYPRKPEGSLGRTAQDGHFYSYTAPELWPFLSGPSPSLISILAFVDVKQNVFYVTDAHGRDHVRDWEPSGTATHTFV